MTEKSSVQVIIGGKMLTMSGYEDELHIQQIASCVNHTIQELEATEIYRRLSTDLKPLLIEINIADALLKAKKEIEQLEADLRLKENELAEVRHDLVEAQLKLEKLEKTEGNRRR